MAKFCEKCGTRLEDDMLFCPNCGNRLETSQPEPEVPVTSTDPEAIPVPEASDVPESVPVPEASDVPESVPAPEVSHIPENDPAPEDAPIPESDPAPEDAPIPEPVPAPEPWAAPEAAPAFAAPAVEEKKRGPGKVIAICLALVLVLGALGFGAWKLLGSRQSKNLVETAKRASVDSLEQELRQLPNLAKMLDVGKALSESGQMRCDLDLDLSTEEVSFHLLSKGQFDYVNGAAGLDLSLELPAYLNKPADLQIYLDREQAQLASSALLEDVFSIPLKDLGKQWNASKLSEMLNAKLREEASIDLFPQTFAAWDYDKLMESVFGQDWTAFRETMETVPVEEDPHFGPGVTYKLTWDAEKFKPLYEASKDVSEKDFVELDLTNLDLIGLLAKTSVRSLGDTEIQYRIENGLLTGVWTKSEKQESDFRLEGGDKPWSKMTVELHSKGGSDLKAEAGLTVADGKLTMEIRDLEADSALVKMIYNDADGSFSMLAADDKSMLDSLPGGGSLAMTLRPEGDTVLVRGSVDMEEAGSMEVQAVFGGLTEPVKVLSDSPRALLSLSKSRLEGVAMKLMLKLRTLVKPELLDGLMP